VVNSARLLTVVNSAKVLCSMRQWLI